MQEINLLVEQKNGSIETNFEEIKAVLAAGLEEYKGMVFTVESQPEAKKTVASLRKLKKAMNDRRIEIKKTFMVPYTNFEAQVKELDKLIDEPINFISGQIEEFERKRVETKKSLIHKIYTGIITEHDAVMEYLPLDRIYDSRWENTTTTQKAIAEAIAAHVEHVEKDLATIRTMESEFEDKGLAKYKATLELSDAIGIMKQYQKQKEEILQRQAEEEQRKAEEKARKATEVERKADEAVQEESVAVKEEKFVEPKPVTNAITYEIIADPFQIVQLESAMREYDIKFRRI
nr:MAG TPA: Protein of unknown function (DUF1351) [Caudoviricetes sp.]